MEIMLSVIITIILFLFIFVLPIAILVRCIINNDITNTTKAVLTVLTIFLFPIIVIYGLCKDPSKLIKSFSLIYLLMMAIIMALYFFFAVNTESPIYKKTDEFFEKEVSRIETQSAQSDFTSNPLTSEESKKEIEEHSYLLKNTSEKIKQLPEDTTELRLIKTKTKINFVLILNPERTTRDIELALLKSLNEILSRPGINTDALKEWNEKADALLDKKR